LYSVTLSIIKRDKKYFWSIFSLSCCLFGISVLLGFMSHKFVGSMVGSTVGSLKSTVSSIDTVSSKLFNIPLFLFILCINLLKVVIIFIVSGHLIFTRFKSKNEKLARIIEWLNIAINYYSYFIFLVYTAAIILINGVMTGFVMNEISRVMPWAAILAGIVPHGIVEIPTFILAITLGFLYKRDNLTLKSIFKEGMKIIFPLLTLAALIETYVSTYLMKTVLLYYR